MQQRDDHHDRDYVGGPEQKEGVHHVEEANERDEAETDLGRALDVEHLVQPAFVFLLSEFLVEKMENCIQGNNEQNQHVAKVFRLVNDDNEAKALKEDAGEQEEC